MWVICCFLINFGGLLYFHTDKGMNNDYIQKHTSRLIGLEVCFSI